MNRVMKTIVVGTLPVAGLTAMPRQAVAESIMWAHVEQTEPPVAKAPVVLRWPGTPAPPEPVVEPIRFEMGAGIRR